MRLLDRFQKPIRSDVNRLGAPVAMRQNKADRAAIARHGMRWSRTMPAIPAANPNRVKGIHTKARADGMSSASNMQRAQLTATTSAMCAQTLPRFWACPAPDGAISRAPAADACGSFTRGAYGTASPMTS